MSSSERILFLLKSRGPMPVDALAKLLDMTEAGVRQHLAALWDEGLLDHTAEGGGVGRPKRIWRLSAAGHARFPDRHSDLTVSLLEATREVFGEAGLDRLIAAREKAQRAEYQQAVGASADLGARVRALAKQRAAEGYMAEAKAQRDGSYLLIENHCPICAAATACQGLCRSELDVFRDALGRDVSVERVEHLLAGARRCAYRIAPKR